MFSLSDRALAMGWSSCSPSGEVKMISSYSRWLFSSSMQRHTGSICITMPASPPKG